VVDQWEQPRENTMWKRREIVIAVTCLAVGSAGQLVQYLVTPLGDIGEADAMLHQSMPVSRRP
jgi:hypothetical protein